MARIKTLGMRVPVQATRLQPTQPGSWRAGMTCSQRGYDYPWQKAREAHLAEHPLCVRCEADGRAIAATVVDHIVPHRGDQRLFWDRTNWQSLCATCHSKHKQREEQASANR